MKSIPKGYYTLAFTPLSAALALAAMAPACLAEGTLFDLSLEELLQVQVTTSSRLSQSIAEAPGLMMVLSREQIQRRGYRNLRDLMQDLPGIEIKSHTLTDHSTSVHMRGVGGRVANDQFVIMLDGHRINEPSSAAISIDDNFPLYMVRQVEIGYGPYSTQYGADAMVGVINLISEHNGDDNQETNEPSDKRTRITLEGGDYNYQRASAYGRTVLNEWQLALGAHTSSSNNNSPAELAPERYQLGDLRRFSGELALPAAERAAYRYPVTANSLFLSAKYKSDVKLGLMHSDYQTPTWGAEVPGTTDYGVDSFWRQKITTLWYDQHWHPRDQLELVGSLDYGRGELDQDSGYRNRFSDFNQVYKYQRSERYQASLEGQFSGDQHQLLLGVQLQQFAIIPRTTDLPEPYDPDRSASAQAMFFPGTDNSLPLQIDALSYNNQAAYGEWIARWRPDLSTQFGLRAEHNSRWGDSLTPRFAFSYKPAAKVTLKGLYGESYKAPTPELALGYFGSFSGQQNSQGEYTSGFFRINNPDLQPERSKSTELTLQYQASSNLLLETTLYRIVIDQIMRPVITATPTRNFIPGGTIAVTEQVQNLNELTSTGLSSLVRYQWQINDLLRWDTWLHYDYNRGELVDNIFQQTIDLPANHDHKLKLGGDLRLGEHWSISPSIYAMNPGNSNIVNPGDPRFGEQSPGYTRIDLIVNWQGLAQGSNIYLRAQNLLNHRYSEVGKPGSANQNLAIQEGRWLHLGLSYQW